jgi:hypothetical protein
MLHTRSQGGRQGVAQGEAGDVVIDFVALHGSAVVFESEFGLLQPLVDAEAIMFYIVSGALALTVAHAKTPPRPLWDGQPHRAEFWADDLQLIPSATEFRPDRYDDLYTPFSASFDGGDAR